MESAKDLLKRIHEWHPENHSDLENALLIGHAGPIRALLQMMGAKKTWDDAMSTLVPLMKCISL